MLGRRIVKCPACGASLDELTVVRYGQSFRCTNCKTELQVPRYYVLVCFSLGMAAAIFLCLAMHLRDGGLAVGLLVALPPSVFSTSILFRRWMPPKLVIYRDPNSILTGG
jgi:hypothetical protein